MFSFPTIWLSTLERGYGHRRVTIFNFVSTPAILIDCVSAHPVLHPGGGAVLGASGDRLPGGYPGGGYPAGSACPNKGKVNITWLVIFVSFSFLLTVIQPTQCYTLEGGSTWYEW